ncbi:hypothetical protein C8Q79DRAFT_754321 [Trametes meyenii]|nr:hypothetical protein C8Q79DRAFT_754321 [Trametes meyenii]
MRPATTSRTSSTARAPEVAAAITALQLPNVVRRIIQHIAPNRECRTPEQRKWLRPLTATSLAFYAPATEALWAKIPSMLPILLLFPEFYTRYHALPQRLPHGHTFPAFREQILQVDEGSQEWRRARQYACLVRALLPDDATGGPPPKHLIAASWLALRRLCHNRPLFPHLRHLHWSPHSSCCDLSVLLPLSPRPPLLYFHLDFREPVRALLGSTNDELGRFYRKIRELFSSMTMPFHLEFTSPPGDLWTIFPGPIALQDVRTLRLQSSRTQIDLAGGTQWYPTVPTLNTLSALQNLENLSFELYWDRRGPGSCSDGFASLKELSLIDLCDGATEFIKKCHSEDLRTLNLDVSRAACSNTLMARRYWPHLCDTIAIRFRHLNVLTLAFGQIQDKWGNETPLSSHDFVGILSPLLHGVRGLSSVSISLWRGEYALSDAVLSNFAGAWPNLVTLKIRSRITFQRPPQDQPFPHSSHQPPTATLRGLEKLAQRCPKLRTLHMPCIHVPHSDSWPSGTALPRLDHRLSELVVSVPYVPCPFHDRDFALGVDRLFPRLDVRASAASDAVYGKFAYGVGHGAYYYPSWYQLLSLVELCQAARAWAGPSGSWSRRD